MNVFQIAILVLLALAAGQIPKGRQLLMLSISGFAVFWLQPAEPFRSLLFWLPTATLSITVVSWALTASPEVRGWKQNWPAAFVMVAVILLMDSNRYLQLGQLASTATPAPPLVLSVILAIAATIWLLLRWQSAAPLWRLVAIAGIVIAFIVLKSPGLGRWITVGLAGLRAGALPETATPLTWLGFSYLAFRLLHTIRDRQSGRLPPVSLSEYVNYAIFFPAFTAGPIDRLERFVKDLRSPLSLANEDWVEAGRRLLLGLFKKFVIADLLAVISINNALVSRVQAGGWLWLFLYAYAFRIYFDFSGYTDMAIGVGRLMGVRLPENFATPYIKPNLTQFWNAWHISLTQWFRSYFFNPVTRALRSMRWTLPIWIIIFATQISTMVLIGLWHGITWGFVVWGLWHGIGLFVHNRWSEVSRNRMPAWTQSPQGQFAILAIGVFLTFNYVALGWLFFTLSRPSIAWLALQKLFGFS